MPSVIPAENTTNAKELVKKPPMSYAEALDVIQACDVVIKKAAANRIERPDDVVRRVQDRNIAKTLGAALLVFASMGASDMMNVIDSAIAAPTAFFGMITVVITGIHCSGTESGSKVMSPLKYRTVNQEVQNEMALFVLKEKAFAEVELKVLKKAKKAMKIINKNISFDNREISYSAVLGKEGFDIVQTKKLSAIEGEKLRLQKMELDSLKEIRKPQSLVALGTGSLSDINRRNS